MYICSKRRCNLQSVLHIRKMFVYVRGSMHLARSLLEMGVRPVPLREKCSCVEKGVRLGFRLL